MGGSTNPVAQLTLPSPIVYQLVCNFYLYLASPGVPSNTAQKGGRSAAFKNVRAVDLASRALCRGRWGV